MNSSIKQLIDKNKKVFFIIFIAVLILLIWIAYDRFSKPEKIVKVTPKKISYNLSSIGLSIKNNGYLFTSKDNGYKKLKLAIEDILNSIEAPALENNAIPENSKDKNIITIQNLRNNTVNVSSIIYVNNLVKTKIKSTPELEKIGQSYDGGNLALPVHEFIIILSGEYKGLLLTKSDQAADKWFAWEINKNSMQNLTEEVRQGVK